MSDSVTIAVIDTGICNLGSVTKALEAVGATVLVAETPSQITNHIQGIVLPGVGALSACVSSLKQSRLEDTVKGWIRENKPFLGVCLGMQALFEHSEEGNVTGLGVFPGKVVKFQRPTSIKIPHMGWNTLSLNQKDSPLMRGLNEGDSFYFVHSFHCVPHDQALTLAECNYGGRFTAIIGHGNVFATQFHPEKSQTKGLFLYKNFVTLSSINR
jgi:imidazole glycerol-phosphate synthase subunit HisH